MTMQHFSEDQQKQWLDNLPKKSLATKIIIKSDKGNVLLVKPNYKDTWQFPGGGIEKTEEPKDAALRELSEELGFDIKREDLKLVDTVFRVEHDNLFLMYEYIPAVSEDIQFEVQVEELEGYKFEKPGNITAQVSDYYKDFVERSGL